MPHFPQIFPFEVPFVSSLYPILQEATEISYPIGQFSVTQEFPDFIYPELHSQELILEEQSANLVQVALLGQFAITALRLRQLSA